MRRLKALLKMTAVRLSAVYFLIFAFGAVGLVYYVTNTASDIIESQARAGIVEEKAELAQIYRLAGIVGLVRSIDRRARQPGAGLYLATDATGRIIAGNVESLQAGVLDEAGSTPDAFGYSRYGETGVYHKAIADVVSLPNGMRVLVGRDQSDALRFREVVQSALILALAAMGGLALIAWFGIGRRALRRLDRMSAASSRILAGDLGERLPVFGAGDEFDRLSENLNTLLARIALLQEGLRQVSDNIAHDLKTPLARLRSKAEAAQQAAESDETRDNLEGIIGDADTMIRTFDALLMISRVEAGSHPIQKTTVDLTAIAGDVAELYEPVAEEAGAALEFRASGPSKIAASRELVAQAISNLVDNALKYGRPHEGAAHVTIAIEETGSDAVISVADNGPGIPEDKRPRVLERFYRLDESRTLPGSGLGLSLVQAIARVHGGRLALEDAGPGLKVVLRLPKHVKDRASHDDKPN
ncbi:HAMP domain-containing sensor histidine kinase [Fulvimarina sp. 2208YS6-2-32]|uniref:histidine kinase n=1 Tax=Fulvimarina uroteuthidis TaxID=3098149 RepID=A0ABU5HYI1_9HYPH|nr:HAMP domain-containing sensor histidine kinase [Fulvimarina sp. 2208YS6-2-32]MDY8107860.1 HAMP domain-containing sensor histidine kinase [Fulvimarina sp. 2208YS6-2-32]